MMTSVLTKFVSAFKKPSSLRPFILYTGAAYVDPKNSGVLGYGGGGGYDGELIFSFAADLGPSSNCSESEFTSLKVGLMAVKTMHPEPFCMAVKCNDEEVIDSIRKIVLEKSHLVESKYNTASRMHLAKRADIKFIEELMDKQYHSISWIDRNENRLAHHFSKLEISGGSCSSKQLNNPYLTLDNGGKIWVDFTKFESALHFAQVNKLPVMSPHDPAE